MPSLTPRTLAESIRRGEFAASYYFHGAEDVMKDEAVELIAGSAVDPGMRDFNVDIRSATQSDPDELASLCNTLPMMAERRVVIVRDVEGWKRKTKAKGSMLRYLDRPSPETVLVLVQGSAEEALDKELASRATVVDFPALEAEKAGKWVDRRARQAGLVLPPEAIEHLLRCVGTSLAALRSEVDKLVALPAGTAITLELIGDLVGARYGETPFDWRDAVLDGDVARATRLVRPVLGQPGASGVKLVTLMGTTLAALTLARAHHEQGRRGATLTDTMFKAFLATRPFGLGDWKSETRRLAGWAAKWPMPRLRQAFRDALEADQALKATTLRDEDAVLLDLTLRLGAHARREAA